MSKPSKTMHRVTLPDGRIESRNSVRNYTHAVIVYGPVCYDKTEMCWHMLGFAGSEVLARKAASSWDAKRIDRWQSCQVVPVDVE
ncbi:MAG: hypothetical protein ACK5X3_04690 [Pseudomonadota bacterium]